MKKKFLAVFLLMALTFTACGNEEEEYSPELVSEDEESGMDSFTVGYGDVVSTVTLACEYRSTESVDLSFGVDNKLITEVNVKKGDFVEKGDLLARVDLEDAEDTISELEYNVEKIELQISQTEETRDFELEEARVLYEGYTKKTKDDTKEYEKKKESLTETYELKLQTLNDNLEIAKLKLSKAKDEYEKGYIYSPISGQVTYVKSELEDSYSEEKTVVCTISNAATSYFAVDDLTYEDYVNDTDALSVSYRVNFIPVETPVYPVLKDQWDELGVMYFALDAETDIDFGTDGKITIELGRKDNVLSVESKAVHTSDKGPFVYLLNNGVLSMQYITVGLEGDDFTEILSGLSEGDVVAYKE